MHPEIVSLCLFAFVTSCSPGPNNILASYSGFNFGILKTIPHMLGVIVGFTTLVIVMNFGLINIFQKLPIFNKLLPKISIFSTKRKYFLKCAEPDATSFGCIKKNLASF